MNQPIYTMNNERIDPVELESMVEDESSIVLDSARLTVYRFLCLAASDPKSENWLSNLEPNFQKLVVAAVEVLRQDTLSRPDVLAPGETFLEMLDPKPLFSFIQNDKNKLIEEYDQAFGLLISKECPPYETEYCPLTFSVHRSQALADIAGYYRAFGLEPSNSSPERHDHLVLELEFMTWLIAKSFNALEDGDSRNFTLCREAQEEFFKNHFAWWIPAFALALRRKTDGIKDERELYSPPTNYLGALAAFLAAFVPVERGILGIAPPTTLVSPVEAAEESEGCEDCQSNDDIYSKKYQSGEPS